MNERTQGFVVVTESYKKERNRRKTAAMKKRSLYCAAALLTVILVLIFNTANIANAGTRGSERYKYFTSIEVQAGTSLWDIAEEYNLIFVPLQDKFDETLKTPASDYWLWDGVHPTEAGHELIGREWLKGFATVNL